MPIAFLLIAFHLFELAAGDAFLFLAPIDFRQPRAPGRKPRKFLPAHAPSLRSGLKLQRPDKNRERSEVLASVQDEIRKPSVLKMMEKWRA